jgi:hypothetical protein
MNIWTVQVQLHGLVRNEYFLYFMVIQPLGGQGLLNVQPPRSHSDTSHSMCLLWTSDQPDAETSTRYITLTETDIHAPAGFEPAIPASEQPDPLCITGMNFVLPKSVRWLRRLVTGLLSLTVISEDFVSPLSASCHNCCMLIDSFGLILSEGQSGEDWKPYNKAKHTFVCLFVCVTVFPILTYLLHGAESLRS